MSIPVIEIRGMQEAYQSLIMHVFMMDLKPFRFFWSLVERPSMTVPKVLQRANQYIVVEALVLSKDKKMHKRLR